jgi:hypothetical protein
MEIEKSYFIDKGEKNTGECLVLTGYWDERLIEVMLKKEIKNIRLSRYSGWADKDISFLKRLTFLKGVEIFADDIKDLRALQELSLLEYVGLEVKLIFDLDFNNFNNLKIIQLRWSKHYKNIFNVYPLEHLNITNYPFEDLQILSNLNNLKNLQVTSTKLRTLKGVNKLINLKSIDLFKCNNLESLDSVRELTSLEIIDLENCKKIDHLNQLRNMINLKTLLIDSCGKIESLLPLKECLSLRKIFLGGDTTIIDGDFKYLLQLPNIKDFWFVNKKHYELKINEVQEILENRNK